MAETKPCPNCGSPLNTMLFMGVQPDFYTCQVCNRVYDLDTIALLGKMIAEGTPKMDLVILRGLPGSGKTTHAAKIAKNAQALGETSIICSSDDYFMQEGKYNYRPDEIGLAHQACQMSADRSMANKYNVVIIDNTNITHRAMAPYFDMAKKYGYSITVITVGSFEPPAIQEYAARQLHGVPREKLEMMAHDFEP